MFFNVFYLYNTECSLTITDDKSVSRKHAAITFPTPSSPLLTDFSSKFGTFINGTQLLSASSPIKSGDKIKFGGASSEFILELKDFSVFVKTNNPNYLNEMRVSGSKFDFEIKNSVIEAAYFILDTEEIDSDLIKALILSKFIVSSAYFSQLLSNNYSSFSLALMQPRIPSFPLDCWIPQKSRLVTLKTAFDGIKCFILSPDCRNFVVDSVKFIGNILEINVKMVSDIGNLKFNELLMSSEGNLAELIQVPIRKLEFESLVDALIRNDGNLIEINTIYPVKSLNNLNNKTINDNYEEVHDEIPQIVSVPSVNQPVYSGRSLTIVHPMPSNFIRKLQAASTAPAPNPSPLIPIPSSKPPKFVKCHPIHRQPGTIPALIGPDQLEPSTGRPEFALGGKLSLTGTSNAKRRVLVKDSWLAEDDFEDGRGAGVAVEAELKIKKESGLKLSVKENLSEAGDANTKSKETEIETINVSKKVQLTTTIASTTPTISSTTTSKFQSSFFKNLSNKPIKVIILLFVYYIVIYFIG